MLTMWLALAALFSDQKGADWSRLIELRARAGKHHGNPPAGYRWVLGNDTIEPVPEAKPEIVGAFEAYASGQSKLAAGRLLVSAGLISTPNQAAGVLANRAYRHLQGLIR